MKLSIRIIMGLEKKVEFEIDNCPILNVEYM